MSAGLFHVIVGVAWFTLIETMAVAVVKSVVSVGVKVTCNAWLAPKLSTVPAAGLYAVVPATKPVAFNCIALKAVPYVMSSGVAHVMVDVAWFTLIDTVPVAVV